MVVRLGHRLWFPEPEKALRGVYNGLLAVGGDLSVERMELAYRSGIFPWSCDPITWWSPDPRAIFLMDGFHVSRSMRKVLRSERFHVTRNRDFRGVIEGCADPARTGGWITAEFIEAYTAMHRRGLAHSVECWQEGRLVGGVYGVAVGGLFAGESMFHRTSNASKVALHSLIQHLAAAGFQLFDIQLLTPATKALGAVTIPRTQYLDLLKSAVTVRCQF